MKAYDIFSELSSKTRLGILQALGNNPMKFTHISEKFKITSPEVSRQLTRLTDAKLIQKSEDGSYVLTIFGRLILSCISDMMFVSEKFDYFSSHDPSVLPSNLLSRIDTLSGGEIITGVFEIMDAIDKEFDNIREYFWYMTDDFPRHFVGRSEERIKDGVDFRIIFSDHLLKSLYPGFSDIIKENVEFRVLRDITLLVDANDRFSRVSLPGADGRIDHSATIFGRDRAFKDWCRKLFEYNWKRAMPYSG
ncbi:MAG: helix-turn-helix transcriptional regulator [Candidatus Hodarchaeales archaeon]